MDIVSAATRSRMMSGIRSANTRPELQLRSLLHSWGFRYRLNTKILACRPDVVLSKYNTALFVHGCFWHRHPGCKFATNPGTNIEKWHKKFEDNILRDRRVEQMLLDAGWRVAVIWECWAKLSLDISWLQHWIRDSQEQFVSWPNC